MLIVKILTAFGGDLKNFRVKLTSGRVAPHYLRMWFQLCAVTQRFIGIEIDEHG